MAKNQSPKTEAKKIIRAFDANAKAPEGKSARQEIMEREHKEDAENRYPDPVKLDATMREIIEALESFVDTCALQFPIGSLDFDVYPADEHASEETFGVDSNWLKGWKMRWYATMAPRFAVLLKRRGEYHQILNAVELEDERARYARNSLHDTVNDLAFCLEGCAFNVGVLMGARLAGASHEQMTRLGMNIYRTLVHR